MKRLLTFIFISIMGTISLSADEAALNKAIEERIVANKELTEELIEIAKESKFEAEILPIEKNSGEFWTNYLTHVQKSKDLKLKAFVLHNEYTQEVLQGYYDLEYEQDAEAQAVLKAHIKEFKAKIEKLEKEFLKPDKE